MEPITEHDITCRVDLICLRYVFTPDISYLKKKSIKTCIVHTCATCSELPFNIYVLGDPEVTANLYFNFAYLYWEGCDLQYIFAVTSGSPSTYILCISIIRPRVHP